MKLYLYACSVTLILLQLCVGQDGAPASAKAALDHLQGTITAIDKVAQTVTVNEDKTGTAHVVQLATTKTLLKVEPTAKDLKSAIRITAGDLEVGDRVDVRGTKLPEAASTLDARAVILMSARALEVTHQQQSAAWAHSTSGRVTAIDSAAGTITADVRTAGEVKSAVIKTSTATTFTRYSPDTAKAVSSQLAQIQPGDQVKVLGDKTEDGSSITAQQIYSGAFRTVSATILALADDGKSMTVKDLANKKDLTVAIGTEASIHKLPPMMAGFLARRLNPGAAATTAASAPSAQPAGGPPAAGRDGGPQGGGNGMGSGSQGPGMGSAGRGDISQMLERLPKIALTDLKIGDALVISGVSTSSDASALKASTIIAGVEPILQSAPQQRGGGRSVGGDWGLGEMSSPQ